MLRRPRARSAARSVVRALRLPEPIRQRLPVDGTFAFEVLGRRYLYRGELHDGVGRALFWGDAERYEPETLAVLVRLLRRSPVSPTIFDVGANTGYYTLTSLAISPAARVHAFEPVQHIVRALSENVSNNRLTANVRINACAVTDRSGSVALHVPEETWGNATLSVDGFRGLRGHLEHVAAVTLDEYAAEHEIERIDVLKIDVEGHENAVLSGARRVMTQQRPAVLCECLPELDADALNGLLREFGYKAFHLRSNGPVQVDRVAADRTGRFKNYLLLPAEQSLPA